MGKVKFFTRLANLSKARYMRYIVKCKNCKAKRQVGIIRGYTGEVVDWLGNSPDAQKVKIISARKRLDDQWGWQCICGNDDLWTEQEAREVESKAAPTPQEIDHIIKNLKPEKPKFIMEAV